MSATGFDYTINKQRDMMDKTNAQQGDEQAVRLQAELDAALERELASHKTRRALLAMLEDVAETQGEVEQAKRELQGAMDAVQDPIFMHNREYQVIRANRAYIERTGIDVRQIIGKPYWQLFPMLDHPPPCCFQTIEHRQSHEQELSLPSGEIFLIRYFPILDKEGNYLYSLHMMQDVTKQRRAEADQRTLSEALHQAAEAMLVLDAEGNIRHLNPAFYRLFGYAPEEILGRPISSLAVTGQDPSLQPSAILKQLHAQDLWQGEVLLLGKDNNAIPVLLNASAIRNAENTITGFVNIYLDLSGIKQAETALRESEEQFRAISAAAQDAILMIDDASRLVFWNESATRIFGYAAEEVLGENVHRLLAPVRYHDAYKAAWPQFAKYGKGSVIGKVLELDALHKNGTAFTIELSVAPVQIKGRWHAVGILRDITERKKADLALQNSLRAHRTLSACNAILVHSTQDQQLMADMCHAIVELGGYRLAWIGLVEHDAGKSIRPVVSSGNEKGYLELLQLTWADSERGQGPAGRAVRQGVPQVAANIDTDPLFTPWREQALDRGYASSISLPLKNENGEVFSVLNIYAAEAQAFDEAEIRLLQELADDLAFGIFTLRTRRERDHYQQEHLKSANQLKEALIGAIRAIALTVEKRDPYTAGHQTRVADLAAAIARELGLNESRIEGLWLGAMIHDIGKIYVPAEILNRPGRLTEHEFGMIKTHAEVGYDIIKDVKFPWPVADMVRQHHERLDGSGYPQGLKGEEIILEARILAVADAVEAITAHRPYRPGLGIDMALAEIEAKRESVYDASVVDACLLLFREKGYKLVEP
jgi:PAS domain S-box-containing protein/putative nucleotidyltransferase with HDIG domain